MERPLRLTVELSPDHCQRLRDACRETKEEPLANLVDRVATKLGNGPHPDFNQFMKTVAADASEHGVKLTAKRKTLLQTVLACREETAVQNTVRWPESTEGRPWGQPLKKLEGAPLNLG